MSAVPLTTLRQEGKDPPTRIPACGEIKSGGIARTDGSLCASQAAKTRPLEEELEIAANTPLPEDDIENDDENHQEAAAGASAQQVGSFSCATETQSSLHGQVRSMEDA